MDKSLLVIIAIGLPLLISGTVAADSPAGVTQIQNFLESLIQLVAGLAGLVATGFFVLGGYGYITSSGNPERLFRAKRTLIHSGVGLVIVIGAFVLSSIVTSLATKAFAS
jgi:hypothetical protein